MADGLGPVLVLLGPVLVLSAAGLVAGLIHEVRIGDVGGGLQSTLSAMLAQAPPALVMGGIAVDNGPAGRRGGADECRRPRLPAPGCELTVLISGPIGGLISGPISDR